MQALLKRRLSQLVAIVLISALVYFGLPIHQDEFIQFFSLKYLDPDFKSVDFHDGYRAFVKCLPFTDFRFAQSYEYIGNVQSVLFYPFYLSLPLIDAKFAYTLISLIAVVVLLKKVFGTDSYWPFILFPPLVVTIIHDSGPVNVCLAAFLGIRILTRRMFTTKSPYGVAAICAAMLTILLVCLFDKVFIIYLVPALFFFSIAGINIDRANVYRLYVFISVLVVFLLYSYLFVKAGVYVRYFESKEPYDYFKTQASYSIEQKPYFILKDRIFATKTVLRSFDYLLLNRQLDVRAYFQRLQHGLFWMPLAASLIFWFFRRVWSRSTKWKPRFGRRYFMEQVLSLSRSYVVMYVMCFMAFVGTFLLLGKVRFGHHTLYLFLPLFEVLQHFYRDASLRRFILSLHVVQIAFLIGVAVVAKPPSNLQMPYAQVHDALKSGNIGIQGKRVVNFSDWYYYFIESLNRDRGYAHVTFTLITAKEEWSRLASFCRQGGYTLINVSLLPLETQEEKFAEFLGSESKLTHIANRGGFNFHRIDI